MDEGGEHEAATDQFEDSAHEKADKTAPPCSESVMQFLAADQFAEDSTYQGAEDDTDSAEEKTDENADRTAPDTPTGASEMFGAPRGDHIIEHRDKDRDDTPDEEHLPREIDALGGLGDPEAEVSDRGARQAGDDASDDADEHAKECEDQ